MSVTTPPSITPVPLPAPQRNDRTTFSNRVDAFVTWLITAVTEFGNVASNVYSNATEAFNSATSASTSASTASTQAGLASTSASTASTQAAAASTSASNAETSKLYVDKLYLGSKATDPTLDNQGAALQAGANYYNSSNTKIRAYTGSAWVDGITSVSGVSTVNGASGAVTVQPTLVSGSNIKTINGAAVLGSGDIAISTNPTWVTKTSNYTAVSGDAIRANTNFQVQEGEFLAKKNSEKIC